MQPISDLIHQFKESDGDPSVVAAWWARDPPVPAELVAVSEQIGAMYLSSSLTYSLANGLMNQLMPLAGWEAAPVRFWQYYVALEDAETLADPDPQAKLAVQAVANQGAA